MSIRSPFRTRLALALALGATFAPAMLFAGDEGWVPIRDEQGIRVYKKPRSATSRVEFRAEGLVNATLVEVTAVMRDFGRHDEWMEGCTSSDALRYPSATSAVGYHRLGGSGPFVSDRDVIIEGTATYDPTSHVVTMPFESVEDPLRPPVDGVVRMPSLRGRFVLTAVDAQTTHVDYRVSADLGGALPEWLVNWVFRRVPYHTLARLRDQVKKPGYEQSRAIVEAVVVLAAPNAEATP